MSLPALALMMVVGVGVGLLYRMENEGGIRTGSVDDAENPALRSLPSASGLQKSVSVAELAGEQSKANDTELFVAEDSDAAGAGDAMAEQSLSDTVVVDSMRSESVVAENVFAKEVDLLTAEETREDKSAAVASMPGPPVPESAVASSMPELAVQADQEMELRNDHRKSRSPAVDQRVRESGLALENSGWLMAQESDRYTIRIATSDQIEYVRGLAALTDNPTAIVRLKNKQWVLLSGSFSTVAEADRYIDSLGEAAISGEQKIVKIGELQQAAE